jgi:hypothetical protein
MLPNACGKFKSAYAQNLTNHVCAYNELKGKSRFDDAFLDLYSEPEAEIVEAILAEGKSKFFDLYPADKENEVYGAYQWFRKDSNPKEWMKNIACLSKEPSYTILTNFKGCVDYIFYQGEDL